MRKYGTLLCSHQPWVRAARAQWRDEKALALTAEVTVACDTIHSLLQTTPPTQLHRTQRDASFQYVATGLTPRHIDRATLSQVLTLVRACVTFKSHTTEVWRQCLLRLTSLLPTMSPKDCAHLVVTLRERKGVDKGFLFALVARATECVATLGPRDATHLLEALASLPHPSRPEVAVAVERRIEACAVELRPDDIARAMVAVCAFHPTSTLVKTLSEECLMKYYDFSVRNVADVLTALSGINAAEWSLFTTLGEEVGRRAHEASREDAGRILVAFQRTPIKCEELARVLSSSNTLRGRRY